MKKIMIAAAIVCAAVASQASQINWSSGNLLDIKGTSLGQSSLGDFTFTATFWAAVSDGQGGYSVGEVLNSGNGTFYAAMNNASGNWNKNATPPPATSTPYFAQLVVTDGAGNTLTSEQALLTTSGSATYSINFGTGSNFATATSKFNQGAGVNDGYGWVSVPEPTSGLLLLLGVAGLALRRRRA